MAVLLPPPLVSSRRPQPRLRCSPVLRACGNPISFYALPPDAGEDDSTLITAVLPIRLTGLGPFLWPRNLSNNPDAYYNRAPPAFTVRARPAYPLRLAPGSSGSE